jgi:hypothetical protein
MKIIASELLQSLAIDWDCSRATVKTAIVHVTASGEWFNFMTKQRYNAATFAGSFDNSSPDKDTLPFNCLSILV